MALGDIVEELESFNEAPANSPGNHLEVENSKGKLKGFNEAPANSPGNPPTPPIPIPRIRASMKPRQIHRGTLKREGINGPERWNASMKPRQIHRGTDAGRRNLPAHLRASMKPRQIHRGTLARLVVQHDGDGASMKPRQIHRGTSRRGTTGIRHSALQ